MAGLSTVYTFRPDGTSPRCLGQIGRMSQLKYSYIMPGGPQDLSCFLTTRKIRYDALEQGRIVKVLRGGSVVWDGQLNEPVYSAGGWQLVAHGAGTFGAQFMARYNTYNLNDPVNLAIASGGSGSLGLRWVNPGIPSGWLVTTQPDEYSETVTDWMNNITVPAGLTWYVGRGNLLSTGLIPTTPNRLIYVNDPMSRTVTNNYNRLFIKFVLSDDSNGNAVNGYTVATNPASAAKSGWSETTVDITAAGVMSATSAANVGVTLLANYQRATFTQPVTVRYGQLRTMGGTKIDLGTEQAGTVCRAIGMDNGNGGETIQAPVSFWTGAYQYDQDTNTGLVTPGNSFRSDISSLLGVLVPAARS